MRQAVKYLEHRTPPTRPNEDLDPQASGDEGFDRATMRSFHTVMFAAKLKPRHWLEAYALFACTVAESKKIAERPSGIKLSTDDEADEAMAACKPQIAELAKVASAREVAAIITAVLRASSAIIRFARSPRPVECARPEDSFCLIGLLR
jgi:hypothetical protein